PGFTDQRDTVAHLLARGGDETLDILRGACRTLREFAHLLRHDGEALAGLAGPRRLDARVERQKVGLEGNIVDDADDVGYFPRRALDLAHGLDGLLDHLARLFRPVPGPGDERARLIGAAAGIGDRRGDLVQCGGGLL